MVNRIEYIINISETKREFYEFDFFNSYGEDDKLKLSRYEIQRRESKRHKWKASHLELYNRGDNRGNGIQAEDITLTDQIISEVKEKFIKQLEKELKVLK